MFGRHRRESRTPSELHTAYTAASDAGDAVAAEQWLRELVTLAPENAWAWFDAGLQSKRRRDWRQCAEDNRRALALVQDAAEDPAAWNLGIAATALGDWPEAMRAWTAFGIDVDRYAISLDPLVLRLGSTPVRLNPEPRHLGETQLLVDGRTGATEVVWCQRLCPARARITNVPTPASGHRFGDVVLHDGEPVGHRVAQDRTYPVFNELAVLERSELPTLEVIVDCPDPAGVEELVATFQDAGLGAEDHGQVVVLCRACSEGETAAHDHGPEVDEGAPKRVALAATEDRALRLLQAWAAAGTGRSYGDVDRVL